MDWEKWDWFFGPDAVQYPVSDGTEPEEENFTFGILDRGGLRPGDRGRERYLVKGGV